MSESTKAPLSTKFFYGSGATPFGIKDAGFNYFILIYYNQVLGLDPFLAGLALALALVIDAVSDILVGSLSDQWHSRFGRRHPFMYLAIVPSALTFFLIWNPPGGITDTQTSLFLYLLLMALLVRSCLTLFEVPNVSLGPELTPDYDDRTRLMGFRYVFGWLGGLTISVLTYMVLFELDPDNQMGPRGYQLFGAIGAATMAIAMLVSTLGTHRHIPQLYTPKLPFSFNLKWIFREIAGLFANRSFISLFISALFFGAAAGLSQAFSIYIGSYFWRLETHELGLIPLTGLVAVPTAFFLAPRLAHRWGKKAATRRSFLFAILFLPVAYAAKLFGIFPDRDSLLFLPLLMATFAIELTAIIIMQVIFGSMNQDLVEDQSVRTDGKRSEGLIFAARNFAKKAVSGVGVMFAGILLWLVNFPDNAVPGMVDESIVNELVLWYLPVIVILYLSSWYALKYYTIDRSQHEKNIKAML